MVGMVLVMRDGLVDTVGKQHMYDSLLYSLFIDISSDRIRTFTSERIGTGTISFQEYIFRVVLPK